MNRLRISKGTILFHGTDCAGDFEIPDGPCWFAFNRSAAAQWVGWSDEPPQGRDKGAGRVLEVEITQDVDLVDMASLDSWELAASAFCGDSEASIYEMAEAFNQQRALGWATEREIMLTRPGEVLRAKAVYYVECSSAQPLMK